LRPKLYDLSAIIDAQPMTGPTPSQYSFKFKAESEVKPPREGDLRHVFGRGWQRFYGAEWVDEALWLKLKIRGF